jgi:hypothetical protein
MSEESSREGRHGTYYSSRRVPPLVKCGILVATTALATWSLSSWYYQGDKSEDRVHKETIETRVERPYELGFSDAVIPTGVDIDNYDADAQGGEDLILISNGKAQYLWEVPVSKSAKKTQSDCSENHLRATSSKQTFRPELVPVISFRRSYEPNTSIQYASAETTESIPLPSPTANSSYSPSVAESPTTVSPSSQLNLVAQTTENECKFPTNASLPKTTFSSATGRFYVTTQRIKEIFERCNSSPAFNYDLADKQLQEQHSQVMSHSK